MNSDITEGQAEQLAAMTNPVDPFDAYWNQLPWYERDTFDYLSMRRAWYDGCQSGTKSPDAHVENVRAMLLCRSQIGLAKYGVTTERTDLDLKQWLTHLQEELLDAVVYIEAAINRLPK